MYREQVLAAQPYLIIANCSIIIPLAWFQQLRSRGKSHRVVSSSSSSPSHVRILVFPRAKSSAMKLPSVPVPTRHVSNKASSPDGEIIPATVCIDTRKYDRPVGVRTRVRVRSALGFLYSPRMSVNPLDILCLRYRRSWPRETEPTWRIQ